jgi:tetratricopeptide (TPR) repeat protein
MRQFQRPGDFGRRSCVVRTLRTITPVVAMCIVVGSGAYIGLRAEARASVFERPVLSGDRPRLSDAQTLFFNARYDAAAALTLELRASDPEDLAVWELRTSGLLFQLKAALDDQPDKEKAFKQCAGCPELLTAFLSDTARGVALARERLQSTPGDETAQFFLGKINLNYVWLQLGPLGRKTGWDEYWEARRSLDAVLKRNPTHVRARVARAWIDYIVDTKMPFGTKWLLGGGNRKRALLTMHDAASAEADFFAHAEARFALWDLHVRERNVPAAIATARGLAEDFPENRELAKYLGMHDTVSRR